jgi:hypothetical protein
MPSRATSAGSPHDDGGRSVVNSISCLYDAKQGRVGSLSGVNARGSRKGNVEGTAHAPSYVFCIPRNQRLRDCVAEHQFWANDQDLEDEVSHQNRRNKGRRGYYFGRESLEERRCALLAQQVAHNRHAARLLFEIRVLDARFDRVERRGDRDRRYGASHRRDEVLRPRRLAIIRHAEYIILRDRARTKELNPPATSAPSGRVSGCGRTAKEPGALRAMVQPQPR